jgi:hypothetical protein
MRNAEAGLDLPSERRAEGLQFALALPLVSAAVPIGVLTIYAPHAFSERCIRSMDLVMPHLTTLLQTAFDAGHKRQLEPKQHSGRTAAPEVDGPAVTRPDEGYGRGGLLEKGRYAELLRDPRR